MSGEDGFLKETYFKEERMKKDSGLIGFRRVGDKGFTLLEYAAGAAVIAGVVYTAMSAFGGGLDTFYRGLGEWVSGLAVSSSSESDQQG